MSEDADDGDDEGMEVEGGGLPAAALAPADEAAVGLGGL